MTHSLTLFSHDALAHIARAIETDPALGSAHSRRAYQADLAQFEAWREGRPLTRLLVEAYAAHLQAQGRSPHTVNRKLAAVRWWARKLGDLAAESPELDMARRQEIIEQTARVAGVRDVKGARLPKGRHLAPGELQALLEVCQVDESAAGARDAAIVALAWATGARRAELTDLQGANVIWSAGDTEAELHIHGKGNKVRSAYLYEGALAALLDWLAVRGDGEGPLFYAINKGGRVLTGHGLSAEALAQMLAKRAAQAGLVQHVSWHDFRRTFAGTLLDSGADLVTVQKLMGHSNPTTTAGYDRRGVEAKRKAVRAIHVPYVRRQ